MSLNKYTQLSYEERVIIENRLKNNESIRYIAKKLNRNASTIAREINRNSIKTKTTRVNKPKELYLDSRHYRGQPQVDIIRIKRDRYYKSKRLKELEFSLWKITGKELNANIYFANPYHSWERGRNENTNGLIRDFLPKGTDFKKLTKRDIVEIANLINNRPRKRLEWKTPLEVYLVPKCCTWGVRA